MFDAKSLLEILMKGAAPQPAQAAPAGGGLGDILGQLAGAGGGAGGGGLADILGKLAGAGQGAHPSAHAAPAGGGAGGLGGLGDILGQLAGAAGGAGKAPAPHAAPADAGGLGGLGDILGKLGGAGAGAGGGAGSLGDILGKLGGAGGAAGGGNLMDVLGKVLGQATEGVREGAGRIGDATGAREAMGRAAGQVTGGQSTDEVLAQLKDLINKHQMGAGAAAGGLGALVLGTRTGRSLAASAAKLGALALIGGLAYKAFANYQQGRPLITGASAIDAPPAGSGFEAQAVTNDQAILYIRAMIGAAAADGRIDEAEQAKILGSLNQGGASIDANARAFLQNEINNPASPEDLAAAVQSPEQALQVYTAARFAIEPDERSESRYLAQLAAALGIDNALASHIEATARSATAAA